MCRSDVVLYHLRYLICVLLSLPREIRYLKVSIKLKRNALGFGCFDMTRLIKIKVV